MGTRQQMLTNYADFTPCVGQRVVESSLCHLPVACYQGSGMGDTCVSTPHLEYRARSLVIKAVWMRRLNRNLLHVVVIVRCLLLSSQNPPTQITARL